MPLLVSCDFVTQTCTVSSQEICLIIFLTGGSCSRVKENIFLVTYPKAVKVLAWGKVSGALLRRGRIRRACNHVSGI